MQVINLVTDDMGGVWREYIIDGIVAESGYAAGNNHHNGPKRWTQGATTQDVERLEAILAIPGITYVQIGLCDIEVWLYQETPDWANVDSQLRELISSW